MRLSLPLVTGTLLLLLATPARAAGPTQPKATTARGAGAKAAEQKAAEEKAAKERAAEEKAAEEKAAEEKAAEEKAAEEKAAEEKAAEEKAAEERASAAKVAPSPATEGKAADEPPPDSLPPPGELPPITFDLGKKLEVAIHGYLQLWFYQPLSQLDPPRLADASLGPEDRIFEVYQASLAVSGKYGDFGVYFNPRFRDTRIREFFPSNVWIQQAYGSYTINEVTISAGKIENQTSELDDNSFYLNLPYFDGIKYESDYGLSVEGSHDVGPELNLHWVAQYFFTDGRTNGSLRDRDTVWIEGATRRHIGVLRVEPGLRFSPTSSLRFGLAAQAFAVNLGTARDQPVLRLDGDLSFVTGPLRLFGEAVFQLGRSVTRYPLEGEGPFPSRASGRNLYAIAGAGVRIWRFYPRASTSIAHYADVGITEMTIVPGLTFLAHEHLSLLLEYAYWPRFNPTRTLLFDNSLNFVLLGRF
jgi:hypothetical protein